MLKNRPEHLYFVNKDLTGKKQIYKEVNSVALIQKHGKKNFFNQLQNAYVDPWEPNVAVS